MFEDRYINVAGESEWAIRLGAQVLDVFWATTRVAEGTAIDLAYEYPGQAVHLSWRAVDGEWITGPSFQVGGLRQVGNGYAREVRRS